MTKEDSAIGQRNECNSLENPLKLLGIVDLSLNDSSSSIEVYCVFVYDVFGLWTLFLVQAPSRSQSLGAGGCFGASQTRIVMHLSIWSIGSARYELKSETSLNGCSSSKTQA